LKGQKLTLGACWTCAVTSRRIERAIIYVIVPNTSVGGRGTCHLVYGARKRIRRRRGICVGVFVTSSEESRYSTVRPLRDVVLNIAAVKAVDTDEEDVFVGAAVRRDTTNE